MHSLPDVYPPTIEDVCCLPIVKNFFAKEDLYEASLTFSLISGVVPDDRHAL